MTDLYRLVPKTIKENLAWRRRLMQSCRDVESQRRLWTACSRDMLFFIGATCWILEPRTSSVLPFIPYPFQEQAMAEMEAAIGKSDVGIDKCRDMGATWQALTVFLWRWMFRKHQSFLLVSRKMDYVDSRENPDALFSKLDFLLRHLPGFLRPLYERTEAHLLNLDQEGSVIDGESTTGDAGRAGRRTALAVDEFGMFDLKAGYELLAATGAVTQSRFFISTPKGRTGAFYKVMHDPDMNIRRIHLDWWQHPLKNAGMYRATADSVEFLGEPRPPDGYKFVRDGKRRSPVYDRETARFPFPWMVAQEWDRDYVGSDFTYFPQDVMDRLYATCSEPVMTGDLTDGPDGSEVPRLTESRRGRLRLWCPLSGPDSSPPRDRRYVAGVDVSLGTGHSASVVVVIDRKTGEKVAELADARTDPQDWADVAIRVCRFFRGSDDAGAFLIWESNGPGQLFGKRIIKRGYRNIYYRKTEGRLFEATGKNPNPGWANVGGDSKTKTVLFGEYLKGIRDGKYVERSRDAAEEHRFYVTDTGGSIVHQGSVDCQDPSGASDNHGDRVIAAAVAYKVLADSAAPLAIKTDLSKNPPEGSFAWRRMLREKAKREADEW